MKSVQSQPRDLLSNEDLAENAEAILDALGLEYSSNDFTITMACGIHLGDKISGVTIYKNSGYFTCFTNPACNSMYKHSFYSYVRGCLTTKKYGPGHSASQSIPHRDVREFIKGVADIGLVKRREVDYLADRTKKETSGKISKEKVRASLQIPSPYYIKRGFSEEILDKYSVGDCFAKNKQMNCRAVIPVFDKDGFMIGCSGRSIYDWEAKWAHSKGFERNQNLFNYWEGADAIKKSGSAIIVESPNNVMRLEEAGIHNSLAIFGNVLGDAQQFMLERLGVMNLIILLDDDKAGKNGIERIKRDCGRLYNLTFPKLDRNDVADYSVKEIQQMEWARPHMY